jgi:hypothetical protein
MENQREVSEKARQEERAEDVEKQDVSNGIWDNSLRMHSLFF